MSEEDPKIQEIAGLLKGGLAEIIRKAKSDDAKAPFQTTIDKETHKYREYIIQPQDEKTSQKVFTVMNTGTLLDKLFVDETDRKPLNGIPVECQLGIIGIPDSGKSILGQEMVMRVAESGKKVVYVISEDLWESDTQRADLQSRMRRKAEKLNINWKTIQDNVLVIDTVKFSELRDWNTFIETYRYIIENVGADLLVVDSITLMDEYRGALKNRLMELCRYNQTRGVTGIYITQRATDNTDGYSIAGGIGLAHNLDINVCLDVGKASGILKDDINAFRDKDSKLKQWTEVRFIRVLGCRLGSFDRKHYEVEITNDGLLRAIHLQ